MKGKYKQFNNAGFTLVEVLIAIAILAIISLPLLNYFSNALSTTARGRRNQRAEMAGQSIVEELSSYRKYEDLDKAVAATGSPWEVDLDAEADALANPEPTPTPDPSGTPIVLGTKKYLINKDLVIDGEQMVAKVKLDFNYPSTASGIIKYNNFEVPQINALYSEKSVVAIDNGDSLKYAVSDFTKKEKGVFEDDVIKDNLKRTGHIDISYKPNTDNKVLTVKVYYEFENTNPSSTISNTLDKTYQAPYLANTEILKEDFTSLYFLFSQRDGADDFVVNYDTSLLQPDLEKIGLYFICQDHETYSTSPSAHGHSINLSGSQWSKVYTNNHNIFGTSNGETFFIKKEKEERIASITVDIYKRSETVFDETTRIARVQSSKGE